MKRRSPLRRFGRRAQRQADEWAEAKLLARTAALVSVANLQTRPNLYRCARCSKHVEHVDVHHLVSRARGGTHEQVNLACLCRHCHHEIHFMVPGDRDRWIRSRRTQRFRNEVQANDVDGSSA